MKQIAKAVIAVMNDVKGLEKNSRVGSGKNSYDGTKDQDVKEVFNESLAKNGLCILPIGVEEETQIDRWEGIDPWSKSTPKETKMYQSVFTKVKTKYMLLHESGESIELAGYGHGIDPQDKGAGKATTYALKNCLLYTFLTPVGKIDDTDKTHSDEIKTPQSKKAKATLDKDKKPNEWNGVIKKISEGVDWSIVESYFTITEDQKIQIVKEVEQLNKK